MAAIQTLLDNATSIAVDKSYPTAISMSRGQRLKTQSRGPSIYRFSVGLNPALKYEENRDLLAEYDVTGRNIEEEVTLSNVSGGSWIMDYQGGITAGTVTVVDAGESNIYVDCSGITAGSGTLFKTGDYIQPEGNTGGYRYPYQVTSDIAFSTAANVRIPVHRPIISQDGVALTSGDLKYGTDCTFRVKMINNPQYMIVPGRYINWTSEMLLSEVLTA